MVVLTPKPLDEVKASLQHDRQYVIYGAAKYLVKEARANHDSKPDSYWFVARWSTDFEGGLFFDHDGNDVFMESRLLVIPQFLPEVK